MQRTSPTPVKRQLEASTAARLFAAWLGIIVMVGTLAHAQSSSTDPTTSTTTSGGGAVTITGSTLTLSDPTTAVTGSVITGLTIGTADLTLSTTFNTGLLNTTTTVLSSGATSTLQQVKAADLTTTAGSITLVGSAGIVGGSTLTISGTTESTGLTITSAASTFSISRSFGVGTLSLGTSGSIALSGGTVLTTSGIPIIVGSSGQLSASSAGTLNLSGGTNVGTVLTTLGTLPTSGTLTLSSGGVIDLGNLYTSGLTLAANTFTLTGTQVANTGISITTASTQTAGSIKLSPLGSVPIGNTPSSASFTAPAMALFGAGQLGGQTVAECGVVYSVASSNSSPVPGDNGVIKVVNSGLPDSTGSFSLAASGLQPNTTYSYRVYTKDSSGVSYYSPTSTFTTPTVLQNWRQTFFGTTQGTSTAADNADPDKDGVPNLIEFATGKNPTLANNGASSAASVNHGGSLEYTYTRSLDALNSGATFTVEWNDTLDPTLWSSTGVTETILSDNGLIQQVKATLPASATGRRFVHLKVLPPAQ